MADDWIEQSLFAPGSPSKCHITLTFATSLDGSIAAERGKPLALSSEQTFRMTHLLRAKHQAIMVGVNTLIADNPSLTTRLVQGPSPIPVILDSKLRTPLGCKLFTQTQCIKPIIATVRGDGDGEFEERRKALVAAGAKVLMCEEKGGRVALPSVFEKLFEECKVESLMIEGGAEVTTSVLQPGVVELVDSIILTVAPMFVGGLNFLQKLLPGEQSGNDSPVYKKWSIKLCTKLGDDIVICLKQ